jgi:nucleoside-diphosphate-sugar epimerase
LVEYAKKYGVKRFVGILSTCIFPDVSNEYPMKEESLHLGPPTETNFSYGYAKRSLAVQIDAYNKQYGTKYQYLTPCNLYGLDDKDGENNSHFITALIKKIFDAKQKNENKITLYGDGSPLRQFMYSDDFAKIIYDVIDKEIYESFNVASFENLSIKEMSEIALKSCGGEHLEIIWDNTKPNGQYRKDVSIEKLKSLLPEFNPIPLSDGIKLVYKNYYDKVS